ncbi:hypothetical protein FRC20_001356 [Serendipita sp. 405]|nr:hypothetical protein FRC20_001356 [Serendipita sp. 405]
MVNVLVLGGTGPTGLALIEEAISRNHLVVVFARSPQKLPETLIHNPSVIVVKGSLEEESEIRRAFEAQVPSEIPNLGSTGNGSTSGYLKIDVIVSALGPPVLGIHPSGHPIAKGYENVIRVAREHRVKRFLILGTASITDENDQFDARFKALVFAVKYFAPHAYEEMVEIGNVFNKADELDWTIARIPVLVDRKDGNYAAGYIGDGITAPLLSRPLFAKFVFDEVDAAVWVHKRPLVSLV